MKRTHTGKLKKLSLGVFDQQVVPLFFLLNEIAIKFNVFNFHQGEEEEVGHEHEDKG